MRKQAAAIMSVLVASTVLSVAVAAPDGRGDRERGPANGMQTSAERLERMADRLGLDETQKQQIENIHLAAQPEIDAIKEQMKATSEARKALAERLRTEVDAVLTEEQRSQLADRDGRRDKRRGRRGGKNRDNAEESETS